MRYPKMIFLFCAILIGLLIGTLGCSSRIVTQPARSPYDQQTQPTNTSMATAIATYTPRITAIATFHPIPTPIPTLNTEQAIDKIEELFKTNAGCQLPCWWGIIPGVSQSENAFNFLRSISQRFDHNVSKDKSNESAYFYFFDIPAEMQYSRGDHLYGRFYANQGTITQMHISGFDVPPYHLSVFLQENGQPNEIWILTYRMNDKSANPPFIVYLLYSEKGMLLTYGGSAKQYGEKINGCVKSSPGILIWAFERKLTFPEAGRLIIPEFNPEEYKTISEATQGKMDVNQFYDTFKGTKENLCIEIDANLWEIIQ